MPLNHLRTFLAAGAVGGHVISQDREHQQRSGGGELRTPRKLTWRGVCFPRTGHGVLRPRQNPIGDGLNTAHFLHLFAKWGVYNIRLQGGEC